MASMGKKTKIIRERKRKPNKSNRKADMKRIQRNAEILKELAAQSEK